MAIGYTGYSRDRKRRTVPPFDTKAVTPAAGFTSTVKDLATFAKWQFRLLADESDADVARPNRRRDLDARLQSSRRRVEKAFQGERRQSDPASAICLPQLQPPADGVPACCY